MDLKKRILIIDDDILTIDVFDQFFTFKEYEVVTADDGLEGLKRLEEMEGKVDLILTDVVMPNISGVGIIAIAKRKYPAIPVVAVTGAGREAASLAEESNADIVMEKPVNMIEMEKIIDQLIAQRRMESAYPSEVTIH
ncbi:MAG: response regulator [Thermodesulfobacteriota bacterium]